MLQTPCWIWCRMACWIENFFLLKMALVWILELRYLPEMVWGVSSVIQLCDGSVISHCVPRHIIEYLFGKNFITRFCSRSFGLSPGLVWCCCQMYLVDTDGCCICFASSLTIFCCESVGAARCIICTFSNCQGPLRKSWMKVALAFVICSREALFKKWWRRVFYGCTNSWSCLVETV